MEIWEIERTIQDLEFKLDSLLQKKENKHYQSYGTDVKYEYGETTVGSKHEIEKTKEELEKYKKMLEIKKANTGKEENQTEYSVIEAEREKNQEEYERKRAAELERLETFKQVKAAYNKRKGQGFRRFMDKLSGNAPKWKQIRMYTQEELEFALKSLSGETAFMKNRNKNESNQSKVSNRNWNNFINILNKKYNLKQQMELEKGGISL